MDSFSDLTFFALLVKHGSLVATAQQMGLTPPAVSKRLAALENRLGVRLLHRTTRRISLTPEGEIYLADGAQVLADLDALERKVSGTQAQPRGLLRIGATLGFGRRHIAPSLSDFIRDYPDLEVQLHLTDRPLHLVEQGFDLIVRVGETADIRLGARRIARNRRLLCAAPFYLDAHGTPAAPRELTQHRCLFIRESDETFGTWHLRKGARQETVKVRGTLSTNDGESALTWALRGHGILMRSEWEIAPSLRNGRLVQVLEEWETAPADVFAVFQTGNHQSAKTRVLIDWLVGAFQKHRNADAEDFHGW